MGACLGRSVSITKELLDRGVDVNAANPVSPLQVGEGECGELMGGGVCCQDGSTALHWAAWKGFPEVVQVLVEGGARMDLRNEVSYFHRGVEGRQWVL